MEIQTAAGGVILHRESLYLRVGVAPTSSRPLPFGDPHVACVRTEGVAPNRRVIVASPFVGGVTIRCGLPVPFGLRAEVILHETSGDVEVRCLYARTEGASPTPVEVEAHIEGVSTSGAFLVPAEGATVRFPWPW